MEDDKDVKRIFNLIIERQPVVDLKLKLFLEIKGCKNTQGLLPIQPY